MDLKEQLVDTWNIHNRSNLYLLSSIDTAALHCVSASKGRSVGQQFAHMHNVRLMWLETATPELMDGLTKIEKEAAERKGLLERSLVRSGDAITALLKKGIEAEGKVKGFKPHVAGFLGYLISHESHHRGQIILMLKQSGHRLDKKISYEIWEWSKR